MRKGKEMLRMESGQPNAARIKVIGVGGAGIIFGADAGDERNEKVSVTVIAAGID